MYSYESFYKVYGLACVKPSVIVVADIQSFQWCRYALVLLWQASLISFAM